jgi:hypothetical protein
MNIIETWLMDIHCYLYLKQRDETLAPTNWLSGGNATFD